MFLVHLGAFRHFDAGFWKEREKEEWRDRQWKKGIRTIEKEDDKRNKESKNQRKEVTFIIQ